jgi:hypothetical protein
LAHGQQVSKGITLSVFIVVKWKFYNLHRINSPSYARGWVKV